MDPMKTKLLRLLLILTLFAPIARAADRVPPEADPLYREGLTAAHQEQWEEAVGLFERSLEVHEHSLTLYMLSQSCAQLEDPRRALDYAERALKAPPPLPSRYAKKAREIIDWAWPVLSAPATPLLTIIMTHDGPRPKDTLLIAAQDEQENDSSTDDSEAGSEELSGVLQVTGACNWAGTAEHVNECIRRGARVVPSDPGHAPAPLLAPPGGGLSRPVQE